jgi:hypothetical protein
VGSGLGCGKMVVGTALTIILPGTKMMPKGWRYRDERSTSLS